MNRFTRSARGRALALLAAVGAAGIFGLPAPVEALQEIRILTAASAPRVQLGLELAGAADPEADRLGARVIGVARGSGAEAAGLRAGDIVTRLKEHELTRPLPDEELDEGESAPVQRLIRLARELEEGDTVRIVYLRSGEQHTAQVEARVLRPGVTVLTRGQPPRVVRREAMPRIELAQPLRLFTSHSTAGRFGLQLAPLNEELGSYFGRTEGVLVLEVQDDAPIALRPGDVILRIGDREVRDPTHAMEILRSYRSDEAVRIEVWRERRAVNVEGRVP